MKRLKDYKKELQTCSKCGLCQAVCPIYKITGKETVVSRGKFNLLLGLIKGDLKYSKNLEKSLSLCLNCKACEDFCPSSINTTEIISCAKAEKKPHCFFSKYNFFFKPKMIILGLIFKVYRFSHFSFFISKMTNFLQKFGVFGKIFILFDKISKINVKRKKTTIQNPKIKVIYFEGCFTKYLNPSTKNALLNILEKNNIEVIQKNFECCGLSALYNGNFELYEKLKEKNSKLLQEDCDYIVCDCATCLSALKEYNKEFSEKVIDITELLQTEKIKNKNNVTYHLPCHLRKEKNKTIEIIKKIIPNYKEMKDYDMCCGFAGDFSFKHPKISKEIAKNKIQNIQKTNTQTILTSCPGCIIGLNKGLIEEKIDKNVLNLVEFVELNS